MAPSDIPIILWRWGSVAVAGDSMSPTYASGDWLIVRWSGRYKAGEVVVVERQERPGVFLIKRIIRHEGEKYWVEGDNKNSSIDSRQWGDLYSQEIRGKVLFRFRKAKGKSH
jgi:nickel-type superoxide dismutase maturation protease